MRRRLTVDGFDAGLEPIAHPIWAVRVEKLHAVLASLGPEWCPVERLLEVVEDRCGWTRRTTQHVLGAAEEFGVAVEAGEGVESEGGIRWRAVAARKDCAPQFQLGGNGLA